MPDWVTTGYFEYARRLPPDMPLQLTEITPGKRSKKANIARITEQEGEQMLAQVNKGSRIVTLEVEGQAWTTQKLAQRMQKWQLDGRDVSFLIGVRSIQGLPASQRRKMVVIHANLASPYGSNHYGGSDFSRLELK